ncbi:MAG: hypothetical protein ACFFBP_08215 [Promethearchaeota archaeon]
MASSELILGMFYSDINHLIHDSIKDSENFSQEKREKVRMLPFKFLGPVFLTSGSTEGYQWKIDFIESSLSLYQKQNQHSSMLQSFFNLNSVINTPNGNTNLFALIGTPHTEDIKVIQDKMYDYIHPSIEQGLLINKKKLGAKFRDAKFIGEELIRGMNLIHYYLGSSRKIYWEEQVNYYCIGLIERTSSKDDKNSYLYTFDKEEPLRKKYLSSIPSYYVMAILPDFYENLVQETLELFEITNYYPNIRFIKLSNNKKKVVYFEEFQEFRGEKRSLGLILIQANEASSDSKKLSTYRKELRQALDTNKKVEELIKKVNSYFSLKKWGNNDENELNKIHSILDNRN